MIASPSLCTPNKEKELQSSQAETVGGITPPLQGSIPTVIYLSNTTLRVGLKIHQ